MVSWPVTDIRHAPVSRCCEDPALLGAASNSNLSATANWLLASFQIALTKSDRHTTRRRPLFLTPYCFTAKSLYSPSTKSLRQYRCQTSEASSYCRIDLTSAVR